MPFFANTPESAIGRADSKNPSTTCRGITSAGRPCRRPLNASPPPLAAQLAARPKQGRLRVDDPRNEDLYCWQHREQATLSAQSSPAPRISNTPILEARSSIDTLADRLGLLDPSKDSGEKGHRQEGRSGRSSASPNDPRVLKTRPRPKPKPSKGLSFCCCFTIPIEEASPATRPHPRPLHPQVSSSGRLPPARNRPQPNQIPNRPGPSLSAPSAQASRGSRHSSAQSTSSQTARYLSLIPPSASAQTASQLLAELAKPVSATDEAGYIYMFWLTPESAASTPPTETARSLLKPPSTPTRPANGGHLRTSDVLASFAVSPAGGTASGNNGNAKGDARRQGEHKKILLKIGRANNVQRRLNEWTRQCGYNLSLIRYYPYISSSSSPASSPATPRKVPHSHKVERMIHIELAGLGMRATAREKCSACGREHREWFEVETSRQGVVHVDEIIRRWVTWDEEMG